MLLAPTLVTLLVASQAAPAPHPAYVEPEPSATPAVTMSPRVTRIEMDVTLDPSTGLMNARCGVTVAGKDLAQLTFRLDEGLVVERTSVTEGIADSHFAGGILVVDLDPPIDGTRSLAFTVTGRPRRSGRLLITPDYAVLGPWDGWYLAFANTWAESSVTVHVPPGWGAAAPGAPVAGTKPGVFTWRASRPLRSIAIAAAPALRIVETKILNTPLRIAAPESGPAPALLAERLRDGLAWMSGALAPYTFDGFVAVFVPKFTGRVRAGGMIVVPAGVPLANAADGADLLAGQWFGERLAGDGPWIEAFGAWQATVFARDRALPLPSEIARLRQAYFELRSGDVPLSRATASTPEEVIRGKGSAAPDMLRLAADDRSFFNAIRSLFAEPVGEPLTLARMRAVIEREFGRSVDRAFVDWFEGTGVPDIQATMRTFPAAGGGWRIDVTLLQTRGVYALPVEVVFFGPGEEHRETVQIDDVKTDLVYDLPFEPVRMEVDPSRKIFRAP